MAKKEAKKSKKSKPSSASSASNQKMTLRVKSNEPRKGSRRQSVVAGGKEGRPNSAKKVTSKQKKKYGKIHSKMPKKPPTAFFYFLEDFRKEFQEQNPDVKSMRDIGKACGEKWKTMAYDEKVKYYDIATEKRAEFDRAMADYVKRKASGEDPDTEDDSEFDEYD